jgi:hypothetical protein
MTKNQNIYISLIPIHIVKKMKSTKQYNRRDFLKKFGIAAGGLAGLLTLGPLATFAQQSPEEDQKIIGDLYMPMVKNKKYNFYSIPVKPEIDESSFRIQENSIINDASYRKENGFRKHLLDTYPNKIIIHDAFTSCCSPCLSNLQDLKETTNYLNNIVNLTENHLNNLEDSTKNVNLPKVEIVPVSWSCERDYFKEYKKIQNFIKTNDLKEFDFHLKIAQTLSLKTLKEKISYFGEMPAYFFMTTYDDNPNEIYMRYGINSQGLKSFSNVYNVDIDAPSPHAKQLGKVVKKILLDDFMK